MLSMKRGFFKRPTGLPPIIVKRKNQSQILARSEKRVFAIYHNYQSMQRNLFLFHHTFLAPKNDI